MSRYATPLRYPGGKQKLSPFILEILQANELIGGEYAEPYAGGAGVAMELLLNGHVSHIHLNDSCAGVYAFWRSVLSKTEDMCRQITKAALTVDEWKKQKAILTDSRNHDHLERGFAFFYLNRCNRSGIVSGGLIGGLAQDGDWRMDARFTREELIRRIEAIASRRKAISLRNWDAERFIVEYLPRLPKKALVYCDPPYFRKAERLYLNHYNPEDHGRIAKTIQRHVKHRWIVSYDYAEEILAHYARRRNFVYELQYNAASAYKGKEVFFFSDKTALPSTSSVGYIDAALREAA